MQLRSWLIKRCLFVVTRDAFVFVYGKGPFNPLDWAVFFGSMRNKRARCVTCLSGLGTDEPAFSAAGKNA